MKLPLATIPSALFYSATFFLLPLGSSSAATVQVVVREAGTDRELPCRVHLKNPNGTPHRAGELPFFRDHFVCPGSFRLDGDPGVYSYEVERGPEYESLKGRFELRDGHNQPVELSLKRLVNLSSEGWWSGDLHVHRPLEQIPLLMQAEDLAFAPVITWWNNMNRWSTQAIPSELSVRFDDDRVYEIMAGEDEREGGALLFFHLKQPIKIAGAEREFPSPMEFVNEAKRNPAAWIDIEKPFWWDVPVWIASGKMDSIGLANNHMCRSQMYETEAWGKPRDSTRLPAPRGNGFWTQEIYYHLLNCGIRIPPSAGSASGVLPNPVGYNRVYVHLDGEFNPAAWWEGLRAGRSFVSNGPLLRCRANGQWPGHVFRPPEGSALEIQLAVTLTSRDPIAAIEIIHNGRIVRSMPWNSREGEVRLEPFQIRESGWFLIRVIADVPHTFRFASTAPFYVEMGTASKHISRTSAQFFLDWVRERKKLVKLAEAGKREAVLRYHDQAEDYWSNLLQAANAP